MQTGATLGVTRSGHEPGEGPSSTESLSPFRLRAAMSLKEDS